MRDHDESPPEHGGFFDTFDSVAHLVRSPAMPSSAASPDAIGRQRAAPMAGGPSPDGAAAAAPQPAAEPYRPLLRLPMALLHVVDDGREEGDVVRMRGDRLVIGRTEGDVVIPHDLLMSPRHAALERLPEGGGWRLTDLGSGTGTYVRVDRAKLRHERMLQVGGTRLKFHEVDLTEAWLIEVSPTGVGSRHECHAPVTTIGRTGCTIALDDPFVSDVHAEVRRTQGGWRIRNTGTNGLWVRIQEPVDLRAPAQFFCGEQRFVFEPLG